ncbi:MULTISPECIES: hypothetical protein [unclassified Pseudomonas]|uniref:hypothetical protein n=1 Tax=unclassified Pseudomonas TaxID=196821 RepID=UPI001B32AC9C|nr:MULTISPECIES: hypothetical protein [unclassified Pseudomonas]
MPLTAYSQSQGMELDVVQLLGAYARQSGSEVAPDAASIPDEWRAWMRQDIECPSCFCKGAEVVKEGRSKATGVKVRQAYYRFIKGEHSSGHNPCCDYAGDVAANHIPENLVHFSSARDAVSKAIRELVCRGIQIEEFSQRDVRAMREWFFNTKVSSQFKVTLEPGVASSLHMLEDMSARRRRTHLPEWLPLTKELLAIPGFNLERVAWGAVHRRYQSLWDAIRAEPFPILAQAASLERIVRTNHGQMAFDPTVLRANYEMTISLARFLFLNVHALNMGKPFHTGAYSKAERPLYAFASLLLFVSGWDRSRAVERFSRIVSFTGVVDQSLGNVIGLNPFHDYPIWSALKRLQELDLTRFGQDALDGTPFEAEVEAWMRDVRHSLGL